MPGFTSWYDLGGGGDNPQDTGIAWNAGSYDGRAAILAINVDPEGSTPENDAYLDFKFSDFSGATWRVWKVIRPWGFWVEDLHLEPFGRQPGSGTLHWTRFCLHTWDTGEASGFSEWEGKLYGFFFRTARQHGGRQTSDPPIQERANGRLPCFQVPTVLDMDHWAGWRPSYTMRAAQPLSGATAGSSWSEAHATML